MIGFLRKLAGRMIFPSAEAEGTLTPHPAGLEIAEDFQRRMQGYADYAAAGRAMAEDVEINDLVNCPR